MKPDFLIIGAEKAGTTWLYDVLRAHPDLYLPDVKEVHFFNRFDSNGQETDNFTRRGQQWYLAHFSDAQAGQKVGEATPMYLCDPDAPERIRDMLPDARFIVMLREPVSRAWSHYRMAKAKAHISEDLDTLIAKQDTRVLGRGLYAAQLARWFALYPPERFLVLFFEEVMSDPAPSLQRIADWLDIDAAPLLAAKPEEARNAATSYRSPGFYNLSVRFARALRNSPYTQGLAGRLKASGLYDLLKRANKRTPDAIELPPEVKGKLQDYYCTDTHALCSILSLSELPWRSDTRRNS